MHPGRDQIDLALSASGRQAGMPKDEVVGGVSPGFIQALGSLLSSCEAVTKPFGVPCLCSVFTWLCWCPVRLPANAVANLLGARQ